MQQQIIFMRKSDANAICGGLSQTSKMPCKSYSLPTETCQTGWRMAQIPGTVCASCYANKGNYAKYQNNIKPAQFARWDSLADPHWTDALVALIGTDPFFRWHDSGDLQGLWHLEKIADVCKATPSTMHWLPTREPGIVKEYIAKHGAVPKNLIVRLSATVPDEPVKVPASLRNVPNVTTSNVHTKNGKPIGTACVAPTQNGECRDCRACWGVGAISYAMH